MPALRSFLTLTVLAACLAQASAGGDGGSGSGGFNIGGGDQGNQGGGSGGQGGGQYGGGQGGGSWGDQGGNYGGGNNEYKTTTTYEAPPNTKVAPQSCPPQTCPPPYTQTKTETTTVTAVSPCTGSTVTAYVTQWQNAPPGCWCGPPPTGLPFGSGGFGGAVAAPVFTASASITPGFSSIPAAEAVKTGVTVAGPAPAAAPTAGGSPGGFFGASSASAAPSPAY